MGGGRFSSFSIPECAFELHELLDLPLTEGKPKTGILIIDTIAKALVAGLRRGESINIPGFGTFSIKERTHTRRAILTRINGKIIHEAEKSTTPPRKYDHFKPSNHLMALVNLDAPNVPSFMHHRAMRTWR